MAAHVLEETRTDALKRRPRLGNARAQPHLLHHSHVSHVAAGNPTSERASPRPYLTCTLLSSLPPRHSHLLPSLPSLIPWPFQLLTILLLYAFLPLPLPPGPHPYYVDTLPLPGFL